MPRSSAARLRVLLPISLALLGLSASLAHASAEIDLFDQASGSRAFLWSDYQATSAETLTLTRPSSQLKWTLTTTAASLPSYFVYHDTNGDYAKCSATDAKTLTCTPAYAPYSADVVTGNGNDTIDMTGVDLVAN